MGTHPCGHVIASAWLHECGMEGDSIRRVLACNAFVGKKGLGGNSHTIAHCGGAPSAVGKEPSAVEACAARA